MRMAAIGKRVADIVYPDGAVCVACGALRTDDPEGRLCRACAEALVPLCAPFCPRCGKPGWKAPCPDCQTKPPDALDGRRAAFGYDGVAGALVRALKYGSVARAADALAPAMAAALPEGAFDALVPVPLHPRRERVRGFNQAALLASALSPLCGLAALDALSRLRFTKTQTMLDAEARAKNVSGAFRARLPVEGLSLLLIDDVLTTGATAEACAAALKAAGAARVALLTAARALPGEDG